MIPGSTDDERRRWAIADVLFDYGCRHRAAGCDLELMQWLDECLSRVLDAWDAEQVRRLYTAMFIGDDVEVEF